MTAYIIRRLLQMIPLVLGVTFLTFALINLIPGSPVARLRDNPKIRPEAAIELERQLGLDKPWPERYVRWLGDLAHGDLGVSLYNRLPVADRIWAVIPNTLLLAVNGTPASRTSIAATSRSRGICRSGGAAPAPWLRRPMRDLSA